MALDTLLTGSKLTAIANATRTLLESQDTYTIDEMASAILAAAPAQPTDHIVQRILVNPDPTASAASADLYDVTADEFGPDPRSSDNLNERHFTALPEYAFSKYVTTYQANPSGSFQLRLRDIELPEWITMVMKDAFLGAGNLRNVTVMGESSGATLLLSPFAFRTCGIHSFTCPRPVKFSYEYNDGSHFSRCINLSTLDLLIDPTAQSTYNYAFAYCPSLTSVKLKGSNTAFELGNGAFYSDSALETVVLDFPCMVTLGTGNSPFYNAHHVDVYVQDNQLSGYQADSGWSAIVGSGTSQVTLHAISDLPTSQ